VIDLRRLKRYGDGCMVANAVDGGRTVAAARAGSRLVSAARALRWWKLQ